jgi:uncharacterized protein (TIGR02147 family)
MKSNLSVYNYIDYQEYLRAYIDDQRENNPDFSLQYFATKAGFRSRSYIHKIANGPKSSLPMKSVFRLSQALNHSTQEFEYFNHLVGFNQAEKIEQKRSHYDHLRKLAPDAQARFLQANQFEYFKYWYMPVIRELASFSNLISTEELGKKLDPAISEREAQAAIDMLMEMNFLVKTDAGYKLQEGELTVKDDISALALKTHQKNLIQLASRSLDVHAEDVRNISCTTVAVNQDSLTVIESMVKKFQQELDEYLQTQSSNPKDRIIQINLQLFPLTAK